MMLHAYSSLYLDKSSRTLGNMLHDAVIEFGMDGTDFLNRFIQSDIAEQFENGSDVYWVGWILAHYQWYSGRTFKSILDTISYRELLGLYGTLHEADVQKSYEVLDAHFFNTESKLKTMRKRCGLT